MASILFLLPWIFAFIMYMVLVTASTFEVPHQIPRFFPPCSLPLTFFHLLRVAIVDHAPGGCCQIEPLIPHRIEPGAFCLNLSHIRPHVRYRLLCCRSSPYQTSRMTSSTRGSWGSESTGCRSLKWLFTLPSRSPSLSTGAGSSSSSTSPFSCTTSESKFFNAVWLQLGRTPIYQLPLQLTRALCLCTVKLQPQPRSCGWTYRYIE